MWIKGLDVVYNQAFLNKSDNGNNIIWSVFWKDKTIL